MQTGARVAAGFAAVLVLTAVVGAIGWKGLQDYSVRVDETQRMKQLGDYLTAAAADAARYHLTQDVAAADSARGQIDAVQAVLQPMREHDTSDEIGKLLETAAWFRMGIDRFVAVDAANRGRLSEMRRKIADIEAAVADIVKAQDDQYARLYGALMKSTEEQKTRIQMTDVINQILGAVLASREITARFESSPTEESANEFVQLITSAEGTATTLWQVAARTDLGKRADELTGALPPYRKLFERLRDILLGNAGYGELPNVILALRDAGDKLLKMTAEFAAENRKAQMVAIDAAESNRYAVNVGMTARSDSMRLIALVRKMQAVAQQVVFENGAPEVVAESRAIVAEVPKLAGSLKSSLRDEGSRKLAERIEARGEEFGGLMEAVVAALDERGRAIEGMNDARDSALQAANAIAAAQVDRMREGHDFSGMMMGIVTAVALLGGLALAYVIGRSVSGPIRRMTAAMRRLADSEQAVEVPDRQRRDEFGAMAAAVQVFKENAEMMGRMEEQQAAERRQAEEEKRKALHELADDFERGVRGIVDAVSSAAKNMHLSAESLNEVAGRVAEQSTSVSAATSQSSANVSTAASATEELASSIAEIGRQIDETSRVTADAVERAAATGAAIRGLASDAQKIGEVVGIITEIAEQTNLLALNATIEAARAGDAGKGFAVVASEVKNLANQTAKATGDIETRVTAIQTATADVVKGIETIGAVIGKISEIATSVASAVEEQGAATQEISRNVQEASRGARTVAKNVAGMNADATQAGEAAQGVLDASTDLARQADALRTDVDQFVASVRSG